MKLPALAGLLLSALLAAPASAQISDDVVRIGVLTLNLDTAKSQGTETAEESRKIRCASHYAAACRGV